MTAIPEPGSSAPSGGDERASGRLETLGRHAGRLVHDLNNLLGVVRGNLDLLTGMGLPAPQQELADTALRAAGLAEQMVKQYLYFLRRGQPRRQLVQLNDPVQEVLRLMPSVVKRAINVQVRLDPELPAILGDPSQMTQMLLNLCLNAADAMPQGGQLEVRTEPAAVPAELAASHEHPPGRHVAVHVRDTGQGMTPEVKARIFEPFFTTKSAQQGTGLGLAIVADIVGQHGGWIDCRSTPGAGTQMSVYLPAAVVEPAAGSGNGG
jgi:signal transduction histidine kinase